MTNSVADPQWTGESPPAAPPRGKLPRWMRWAAAAILLTTAALYFFWPHPAAHVDSAATLKVEGTGVVLTSDAPQWQYVQLAVAEESPPLPPVPAPGRVDFDEKRTANVGTPLSGRADSVLVRV